MVSTWVKNGVPQGQILKSEEPHGVVPHMKACGEYFSDQLEF
jgi:hypothetical protein